MRTMIRNLVFALGMGALVVSSTGCASYTVYRGSEKIVATRKAMEIRDPRSKAEVLSKIKAGEVGQTGLDLPFVEVLKERPWWQGGAAALDVTTGLLLKEGYDSMTDDDSGDREQQNASRSADKNVAGGDQIFVQGNAGGDINVNLSAPAAIDGLGDGGFGDANGFEVPVGTGPQ